MTSAMVTSSCRPKLAAGVGAGKVLGGEAARIQQATAKRIAQGQLGRGRGGRGQPKRTGFLVDAGVQVHIGMSGQGRRRVAGHGDQSDTQAFDHRQQAQQFFGLAGI
jgi:hypothetical protein